MVVATKRIKLTLALTGLLAAIGCSSTPVMESAPITPDHNAVRIISHVKAEPSSITGGGMIYELFVGGHFNAEFNDSLGVLKLTDLENETTCTYDTSGMLTVPESARQGYAKYCLHLSNNTAQYFSE